MHFMFTEALFTVAKVWKQVAKVWAKVAHSCGRFHHLSTDEEHLGHTH